MDTIESKLKSFLDSHRASHSGQPRVDIYPTVQELLEYFNGRLDAAREKSMLRFIAASRENQDFILRAREIYETAHTPESNQEVVPAALLARTQASLRGRGKAPIKRSHEWLWFSISLVAFAASFVIKRYFLQCLVVSLLFGIKWLLDRKTRATKLLIYQPLPTDSQSKTRHSRLQDDERKL